MTKYSLELKVNAVLSYLDGHGSFKTIAERFGVSVTPLKGWVALYQKQGVDKGTIGKIAPNILACQFTADKPNEKWVTDITEFKLFGEKLYQPPVLDLFNRQIITYTIGSRPTYSLVSEMLEKAFESLSDVDKLLIHSDQGVH